VIGFFLLLMKLRSEIFLVVVKILLMIVLRRRSKMCERFITSKRTINV